MRFVREAESLDEQNLVISQEGYQLFYTTTKSIEPKEELKVGYTSTYAKQRGLQLLPESRNDQLGSQLYICVYVVYSSTNLGDCIKSNFSIEYL